MNNETQPTDVTPSGPEGSGEPKVCFGMSVSLDGFVNGPDGDLSWHKVDDELFEHFIDLDREVGFHVYGRRLYETMQYWETVSDADLPDDDVLTMEYARIWNEIPKIVVSTTLDTVNGKAELIRGGLREKIQELKDQSMGDISVGGPTLVKSLAAEGLVDEYHLYVTPVVVGGGTPFFSPGIGAFELELIGTQCFNSGVILERYRPLSKTLADVDSQ